eukprot:scaffold35208_cov34-Phaeocystis_antarctica.AAC.4
MSGHHPATVRRAGRKRGARFESSEALAEQPAVARSAVGLGTGTSDVKVASAGTSVRACAMYLRRSTREGTITPKPHKGGAQASR